MNIARTVPAIHASMAAPAQTPLQKNRVRRRTCLHRLNLQVVRPHSHSGFCCACMTLTSKRKMYKSRVRTEALRIPASTRAVFRSSSLIRSFSAANQLDTEHAERVYPLALLGLTLAIHAFCCAVVKTTSSKSHSSTSTSSQSSIEACFPSRAGGDVHVGSVAFASSAEPRILSISAISLSFSARLKDSSSRRSLAMSSACCLLSSWVFASSTTGAPVGTGVDLLEGASVGAPLNLLARPSSNVFNHDGVSPWGIDACATLKGQAGFPASWLPWDGWPKTPANRCSREVACASCCCCLEMSCNSWRSEAARVVGFEYDVLP